MKQRRLGFREFQFHVLTSSLFLASLSILLFNDFILKSHFHGELTGKISDIAGISVFALFWYSFVPQRKLRIFTLTALIFTFWKSPLSQPVINGWNELGFFSVGRTIDYTDLLALLVLPLLYVCELSSIARQKKQWASTAVLIVAVIAFTATSFSEKTAYEHEYCFPNSKKDLIEKMSRLPEHEVFDWFLDSETFEVVFDSCIARATINVSENSEGAVVKLTEIDYRCPNSKDKDTMRTFFEREFINRLKAPTIGSESKIQYIWATRPPDYQESNQKGAVSNGGRNPQP